MNIIIFTKELLIYDINYDKVYFIFDMTDMYQFVDISVTKDIENKCYHVKYAIKGYKEKTAQYDFSYESEKEVRSDKLTEILQDLKKNKYPSYSVWTQSK